MRRWRPYVTEDFRETVKNSERGEVTSLVNMFLRKAAARQDEWVIMSKKEAKCKDRAGRKSKKIWVDPKMYADVIVLSRRHHLHTWTFFVSAWRMHLREIGKEASSKEHPEHDAQDSISESVSYIVRSLLRRREELKSQLNVLSDQRAVLDKKSHALSREVLLIERAQRAFSRVGETLREHEETCAKHEREIARIKDRIGYLDIRNSIEYEPQQGSLIDEFETPL
jgi:hypothetical protein